MMTELSMTISRVISAPTEQVFNAWLDPAMLVRFMTPGPGMTVPHASTDPVEGGRFDIVMQGDANEIPHAGTYKKIAPHSQLVFTWESPVSVDDSTVTLDFVPVDGGTEITLTHVKFANEEMRANHMGGWTSILAALTSAVEA